MAASPLMPVKAYALFAGMAVLATALLATTLFPPVRAHHEESPAMEVQQRLDTLQLCRVDVLWSCPRLMMAEHRKGKPRRPRRGVLSPLHG